MSLNNNRGLQLKPIIILTVYFLAVAVVLVRAYRKPEYNWDMLAYMAVVISRTHNSADEIHRETYNAARENLSAENFQQLVNPANNYRKNMYLSDTAFYHQLPFYVVKPLFTTLVWAGYRAGFPLTLATVLPSLAGYLFIAILLLIWFSRYLQWAYAAGAALLIMFSAPLLTVSGLSTPDALSAFLLLAAFYFSIEVPRLLLVVCFMTASILTRLDNILVCTGMLFFMAIARHPPFGLRRSGYAMLMASILLVYLLVARQATAFGFSAFFYPTFMRYMNMPHQYQPGFSWSAYLQVLSSVSLTGLYHSAIALFGFLALLLFCQNEKKPLRSHDYASLLPLLFALLILLRFALDPDISDRFYIPYYLLIAALWVRRWNQHDAILQSVK